MWQVEKDAYCRAVLAKHWPSVERFEDVCDFHPTGSVDVLCGGFPCQPWSVAGKQGGVADIRHLWPEFARIIDECFPAIVVGENVPGLRARGLRVVLADLATRGFDVEWTDIRASDVGAPHRRDRLFIVATHPNRIGVRLEPGWLGRTCGQDSVFVARHGETEPMADSDSMRELQPQGRESDIGGRSGYGGEEMANPVRTGLEGTHWSAQEFSPSPGFGPWATEPNVGRVVNGFRSPMDRRKRNHRLKALGNAVVPQVAEVIGRAIVAALKS